MPPKQWHAPILAMTTAKDDVERCWRSVLDSPRIAGLCESTVELTEAARLLTRALDDAASRCGLPQGLWEVRFLRSVAGGGVAVSKPPVMPFTTLVGVYGTADDMDQTKARYYSWKDLLLYVIPNTDGGERVGADLIVDATSFASPEVDAEQAAATALARVACWIAVRATKKAECDIQSGATVERDVFATPWIVKEALVKRVNEGENSFLRAFIASRLHKAGYAPVTVWECLGEALRLRPWGFARELCAIAAAWVRIAVRREEPNDLVADASSGATQACRNSCYVASALSAASSSQQVTAFDLAVASFVACPQPASARLALSLWDVLGHPHDREIRFGDVVVRLPDVARYLAKSDNDEAG